jgi:predicted amidohydrolase
MKSEQIRIALAALEIPASLEKGAEKVKAGIAEAASKQAEIICFPET